MSQPFSESPDRPSNARRGDQPGQRLGKRWGKTPGGGDEDLGTPVRQKDSAGAYVPALLVALAACWLCLCRGGTAAGAEVPALALVWLALTTSRVEWPGSWLAPVVAVTLAGCFAILPPGELVPPQWATFVAWYVRFYLAWTVVVVVASLPRRPALALAWAVVALALFQAGYGLWAAARGEAQILGIWERTGGVEILTGTFINRNHVVDVLAAGWLLGLGLTLAQIRWTPLRWSLLGAQSLFFGAALFATQSRGGVLAFAVGALVFAVLASRRRKARWARGGGLALSLILGAVAAIWFGVAGLASRFLAVSEEVIRLHIWREMLSAPLSSWFFGVGPGQFQDTFRTLKSEVLVRDTSAAHNDWLEFVFEFGLLGAGIVFAALLWWAWRNRPERVDTARAAAIGALAVFLTHALGDFALQIPGAAVICAIVTGLVFRRTPGQFRRPPAGARLGEQGELADLLADRSPGARDRPFIR